jgi:hypothetical protein
MQLTNRDKPKLAIVEPLVGCDGMSSFGLKPCIHEIKTATLKCRCPLRRIECDAHHLT